MNRCRHSFYHIYLFAASPFPWKKTNVHDVLEEPEKKVPETGIERVKAIFREIRPGESSPELVSIAQLGSLSLLMGLFVGGIHSGHVSYENFMLANRHVRFVSPYEAKRKLNDTIFLEFLTGGFKWGLKVAVFTVIFSTCVTVISAYRNKDGVIEYTIGGALAGAVARAYLGVKATLAGAFIGSAFTTPVGLLSLLLSKFADVTISDVREMQYGWFKARREGVENFKKEILKSNLNNPNYHLFEYHDKKLKSMDTSGYSDTEKVYVLLPLPNVNEDSSEPPANKSTEEIKNKTSESKS